MGALLLYSGASKLLHPLAFSSTLTSLGWSSNTLILARALGAAELVAGFLSSLTNHPLADGAVVVLGIAFAGAGVHAMTLGISTPCNCFGNGARHQLGVRQLYILPAWIVVGLGPFTTAPKWAGHGQQFGGVLALLLAVGAACLAVGRIMLRQRRPLIARETPQVSF